MLFMNLKKMLKFAACGAMIAAVALSAGCGGGEKKADQKVLKVGMECAYAPYNCLKPLLKAALYKSLAPKNSLMAMT